MKLTNRQAAQVDVEFRRACERVGVYPSRIAYRKWKSGRGLAFQKGRIDSQLVDSVSAK